MTVLSAILLLFLVMDPLGNIPAFLSVLTSVNERRRMRVMVRELLLALLVLLVFLFCGRFVLGALQINESSLNISGGIILFLISLKMVFSSPEGVWGDNIEGEPLLVPLAIPFIAGPSALATVLLFMAREPQNLNKWLLALVIAWAATAVILLLSYQLSRLLRTRGLIALERLMGLVLVTVAVQMFLSGVKTFLASL